MRLEITACHKISMSVESGFSYEAELKTLVPKTVTSVHFWRYFVISSKETELRAKNILEKCSLTDSHIILFTDSCMSSL